jgi:negative regulator of sigma E activity
MLDVTGILSWRLPHRRPGSSFQVKVLWLVGLNLVSSLVKGGHNQVDVTVMWSLKRATEWTIVAVEDGFEKLGRAVARKPWRTLASVAVAVFACSAGLATFSVSGAAVWRWKKSSQTPLLFGAH